MIVFAFIVKRFRVFVRRFTGGTMVGYAGLGVQLKYLVAASFMSPPAGLMMAKLLVPQTEGVHTMEEEDDGEEDEPVNMVDAASRGALSGLQIAMAIEKRVYEKKIHLNCIFR